MTACQVKEPARPNDSSEYRFISGDDEWEQLVGVNLAASTLDTAAYEDFNRLRTEAERALVEAGHARWFGAFEDGRLQASLGLVTDGEGVARFQQCRPTRTTAAAESPARWSTARRSTG
jgi:hypothetical protein